MTVLIAVAEDSGGVDVQQYLFPVRERDDVPFFGVDDGRQVRRLDLAQRHYGQGAPLEDLDDLLYGKWLDPLLGALGGYALIRAGKAERYVGHPTDGDGLQASAMKNMLNFFGGLPDSHILAGMCEPERRDEHFGRALALGLPVFSEGFLVLFEWYRTVSGRHARPIWVDRAALIPGSPWTAWVAERPVITVTDGSLATVPPGWTALDRSRDRVERAIAAVGSVHSERSAVPLAGTAFAIAPGVVMTMGHVLADPPYGDVSIDFSDRPGNPGARFAVLEELGRIERPLSPVVFLRTVDRAPDGTAFPEPLRLAGTAPAPRAGG